MLAPPFPIWVFTIFEKLIFYIIMIFFFGLSGNFGMSPTHPQTFKNDASCLPCICNSQQNYRLNPNIRFDIKSNQAALKINQVLVCLRCIRINGF